MKYGFVIDNQSCIGCHACTVACKAEHQTPIGVNRTWVKYIEKGEFPNTTRNFTVLRCNHCEDAPCVNICPTAALFKREDGIVDFDNDRCIGCKSCMQACPYDALHIDPELHTAAKCNYCAHRTDIGIEPACVNVCPTQAIISGDLDDKDSKISQTIARNRVSVRKAEKGAKPKLYYIEGDETALNPSRTYHNNQTMWGEQTYGVGHHAKHQEKMYQSAEDAAETEINQNTSKGVGTNQPVDLVGKIQQKNTFKINRVYDSPNKGVLWNWEVAGYIFTKAIASGIFIIPLLIGLFQNNPMSNNTGWITAITSLIFLTLTGILLVKDLDQPKRFLYVLLRPAWNSWLVKGAYIILFYGGLLSFWMVCKYFELVAFYKIIEYLLVPFGVLTSIYTAFLFSQAKARDFWQNPLTVVNMLLHTVILSACVLYLFSFLWADAFAEREIYKNIVIVSLFIHIGLVLAEYYTPHMTVDATESWHIITKGVYKNLFWFGSILFGTLLPLAMLLFVHLPVLHLFAIALTLIGVWFSIKIWVTAPQLIPLA